MSEASNLKPTPLDHPGAAPTIADAAAADVARLLQAAATGDEDAWRAIVRLYARRIYALARSRLCPGLPTSRSGGPSAEDLFTRGHDAAEEVTQSVFVTVASKLASGEYTEHGRFESWLFRVAMNRIRDEARRLRRQARPTDPDTLDGSPTLTVSAPADHPAADELAALRSALDQLGDADREIIELRHHAGMSFKQMADLLAEPIGTLLARHHRALRKLKDLMTTPAGAQPTGAKGDAA